MHYQNRVSLYTFRRWEAWLWAVVGIAALAAIQVLNCRQHDLTVTWQRLTLSAVCGCVGGLVVWCLHFPLRWWLATAAAYYYGTTYWKAVAGEPWPYSMPEEMLYLWLACGVAGTFLYTRWLLWRYEDYPEGLTPALCFYGCFLGAPILAWGLVCYVRRCIGIRRDNAILADYERKTGLPWQTLLRYAPHPQPEERN